MSAEQERTKLLRLITPEAAQDLGVPAEGPVFVSPIQSKATECRHCHTTYTALMYYPGAVVQAQHFHEAGGGIYYYSNSAFRVSRHKPTGWAALITPHGRVDEEDNAEDRIGLSIARAESVTVDGIGSFCYREGFLKEGIVYQATNQGGKSFLVPECYPNAKHDHPRRSPEDALYHFRIQKGYVLFSSVRGR